VLVPDLGQARLREASRELHERGPQAPVDVGDLAVDQLADEHVVAVADGFGDAEDFMAFGVGPPTAADGGAGDRLGEAGDGTARGLQDDAVAFDEGEALFRGHAGLLLTLTPPP